MSVSYMKVELSLTEQLFASRLGIHTILFRPPYSIDPEPDTEDQVRPLEFIQDMGYITVGNKIDPNDWKPGHSAAQIDPVVLAHIPPCDPNDLLCGSVILMHDGGGDRSETVGLAQIIDGVRAKGMRSSALAIDRQNQGRCDASDSIE